MTISEGQKIVLEVMQRAFSLQECSENMRLERLPTLRDQFAMAALGGYLSSGYSLTDEVASDAYHIADVMLKEREK